MLAESRRSQLTQINAWMLGQVILLHHNGPNSDEFMRGPWATKAIIDGHHEIDGWGYHLRGSNVS